MNIVRTENLSYDYLKYSENEEREEKERALSGVTLSIRKGSFTAVLGANGSGKSTLAKHINALLLPSEGAVYIDGQDTAKEPFLWKIRQKAGMVFQNPDNQIIASSVEEDVGFGPENTGTPREVIWERVEEALRRVGMLSFRKMSPNRLSGGQKQRVAIAGIVAMRPQVIVLDEPTAMLDPGGRAEVLSVLKELNRREGVTVVLITHYMEEVVEADEIFVMKNGKLILQGTPSEVFAKSEELERMHLDVPPSTLLADRLRQAGAPIREGILTERELADEIFAKAVSKTAPGTSECAPPEEKDKGEPLLTLEGVSLTYDKDTGFARPALSGIDLSIYPGEFIAVIGHTGSGKSTLIQLLDGLLAPTEGTVRFRGEDIHGKDYDLRALRTKVGLVFQYPENQLFEEDLIKDVSFGPRNQGLPEEEVRARAVEALESVGIRKELFEVSPFELSGGQKRRVAIAGVLAMKPQVLILDEPTAGLDPKGRERILGLAASLHREKGITVILVTHSMEDAARFAERLIVLADGTVRYDAPPKEVFLHVGELKEMGLNVPQVTLLMRDLKERGLAVPENTTTAEEALEVLLPMLKQDGR